MVTAEPDRSVAHRRRFNAPTRGERTRQRVVRQSRRARQHAGTDSTSVELQVRGGDVGNGHLGERTAVGGKVHAGHEGSFVGREEQRDVGDVFGQARAA